MYKRQVFNGGVEKVTPVEANVVLVSRPGDPPPAGSDNPVKLRDERSLGNNDNARQVVHDAADDNRTNDISCQSRVPRRPRKRSSVCNNVDEVVVDVQSDVPTSGSGRKTSVSQQRHADAGDREHRPKRKGNNLLSSLTYIMNSTRSRLTSR